jgi:hypothetical protein
MGVLMKSGSGLTWNEMADRGAADRGVAEAADLTSEGNEAVTGVVSFSSLGLGPGILTVVDVDCRGERDLPEASRKREGVKG